MITIEELKNKIEQLGYLATEELIYDTFNAICMFNDGKINSGQDIYAICLEGPPGAGKTEFAKTYTKLANNMFENNVEMVDYQCDATTGKTELFEDINISAAIRGDADNVNIPGKLVEAINKVNSGKKVVLFIDEYDKAREETDAFLLQFLQSGKINSTQHGDLEIKEEYKSNLQVIICKNDMREELSGPLSRRIRIIRLDYMEPTIFYKVAYKNLIENKNENEKVNDGLLNLVSLMYQNAFESKEMYNRLPSCSEMLIAIEDANRLMTRANAPQYIIYNTIIRNMFKSIDDIKTFESKLENTNDDEEKKLKELIDDMKKSTKLANSVNLKNEIAEKIFIEETENLNLKTTEMQKLINYYKNKFAQMEEKRRQVIDEEIKKILLENGKLVSNTIVPNTVKNFEDESLYVKRGFDIFKSSENDWVEIGEMNMKYLSLYSLVNKIIEFADKLGITIYENGFVIREEENQKLIVITESIEENNINFKIMADSPVIPSTYVRDILCFIDFLKDVRKQQPVVNVDSLVDEVIEINADKYSLNTLIYNDNDLNLNHLEKIQDNVYSLDINGSINNTSDLSNISQYFVCSCSNNAIKKSQEIMNGKGKVLSHE